MCSSTNQLRQTKSSQNFLLETCSHHSPSVGRDHKEVSCGLWSAFSLLTRCSALSSEPRVVLSLHMKSETLHFPSVLSFSTMSFIMALFFSLEKHQHIKMQNQNSPSIRIKLFSPRWSFILYSLHQNLSNNPFLSILMFSLFAYWSVITKAPAICSSRNKHSKCK